MYQLETPHMHFQVRYRLNNKKPGFTLAYILFHDRKGKKRMKLFQK